MLSILILHDYQNYNGKKWYLTKQDVQGRVSRDKEEGFILLDGIQIIQELNVSR